MIDTLLPVLMLGTFAITSAAITFYFSKKPPKEKQNSRNNQLK